MTIYPLHIDLRKPLGLVIFVFISSFLFAQQSEQAFLEAYAEKGAQEFFHKNSRASSGGYLYVAGASINDDGNYDMLLTKYNGSTEIWSVSWNGAAEGDDYAADVLVDGSGSIYICGTSEVTATNYNAVVVKYNSSGTFQWASSYAGPAGLADGFVSIAVDGSGNIYSTGGTQTTTELTNFLTVKYNSSGTQQWASTYDYMDLQDLAVKILVSGSQVRVSGGAQGSSTSWKMATVAYNASTGAQGTVMTTGGDDEGIDLVADAWTDGVNTIVIGSVVNSGDYDWKILKLDSNLTVTWSATYDGPDGLDDRANGVKVDGSGNVYVTGYYTDENEGKNFMTRKYNSSGTIQWASTFNEDTEVADDQAHTIELDASGHVIVSGSSYKDGNKDYLTIKYKYTDGSEVWRTRFNSDYNDDDISSNIALDEAGNIYVIGTAGKGDGTTTYMMCKYSVKNIYMPLASDGYSSSGGYNANKGQLRNNDGTTNTSVKFYNINQRVATYVENRYTSYQLVQATDTTDADTTFRVRMDFTKGSTSTKVYPYNLRREYHNYYLGHMAKQSERTEIVNTVLRPSSYTNTDVIFTHSPSGFRHWIVARTGAPTADFEMTFTGQSDLSIDGNGNLLIETTIGDIEFTKAKAYSMNNTTGALTLLGWQPSYSISGSAVSFTNFGSWSGTLVLEFGEQTLEGSSGMPTENLEWSTCFGGAFDDQLRAVAADEENLCWVAGYARSLYFPEMGPNIIGESAGGRDAVIGKFNEICEPVFLLFYGGSEDDEFTGVAVIDKFTYVCGFTNSSDITNYSSESLNDDVLDGETDGIYVKFNPDGEVVADSYIGGAELDHCVSIDVVKNPGINRTSVFLCGPTNSDDFDVSGNVDAYVSGNSAGNFQDSFIMELRAPIGEPEELVWSTCIGTDALINVHQLSTVSGSLVVTGYIASSAVIYSTCDVPPDGEFPECYNSNSWPGVPSSEYNGFFMAFDSNNELFYSVVFPGSPRCLSGFSPGYTWETIAHIAIGGNIFCDEVDDFPFTSTGFQQTDCSDFAFHGFLMKFKLTGETVDLQYATLLGEADGETAIETVNVDSNRNIYFAGYGDEITTLQDEMDYCIDPDVETMPICNSTGQGYMETDLLDFYGERTYLGVIGSDFELRWSTLYGDGIENRPTAITSNEDKLFLVGWSDYDWTMQQFDDSEGSLDYYRLETSIQDKGPMDGTIARFGIEGIFDTPIGLSDSETTQSCSISPNPTNSSLIITSRGISTASINLFNSIGNLVISNKAVPIPHIMDLQHLANGLYTLQFAYNSNYYNIKFIKQ